MTTLNLDTSNIVQLAFLAMEKTPPASFGDASDEAALTQTFYPMALQRCLEGCDWSFASTFANLPGMALPTGVAEDPALPYLYALPGDALRLREVGDGLTPVRWRIDNIAGAPVLRANAAAPLPVRYTARVATESLMPVSFREYVATQMAIYLAPKFLVTETKMDRLEAQLKTRRDAAEREDSRTASEARYDGLPDQSDWATEATQ